MSKIRKFRTVSLRKGLAFLVKAQEPSSLGLIMRAWITGIQFVRFDSFESDNEDFVRRWDLCNA